jgi:hypothetical protein
VTEGCDGAGSGQGGLVGVWRGGGGFEGLESDGDRVVACRDHERGQVDGSGWG